MMRKKEQTVHQNRLKPFYSPKLRQYGSLNKEQEESDSQAACRIVIMKPDKL